MDDLTPSPAAEAIMRAIDRKNAEKARWEDRMERYRRESEHAELERAAFLDHCQPATLLEYTAWMIGYLQSGGEPSHVYDYEFDRTGVVLNGSIGPDGNNLTASPAPSEWWVLAEAPHDEAPSLYGSRALKVIVPTGVRLAPGDLPKTFHGHCGHSTFYFMDGYTQVGDHVPVYADMLPVLAAGL